MASTPVEYDLLDLEIEYWQAVRDKSADAALRLTDEGCLIAGASGVRRLDTQSFAAIASTLLLSLQDADQRSTGTEGWQRTGHHRHGGDHARYLAERRGVGRRQAEQHRRQQARDAERDRHSSGQADEHESHAVRHHEPYDVCATGTERHANADFAPTLTNRVHDDGVDASHGE